jgi:hypothetical protein
MEAALSIHLLRSRDLSHSPSLDLLLILVGALLAWLLWPAAAH